MASAAFGKCKKPCKGLLGGEENLKPRDLDVYSGVVFHNVPNSEKNFQEVLPAGRNGGSRYRKIAFRLTGSDKNRSR